MSDGLTPPYSAPRLLLYGKELGGGTPMRVSRGKFSTILETLKRWYKEFW